MGGMDGTVAALVAIAFIAVNVFWLLRITVFSPKDQPQQKPEKKPATPPAAIAVTPPVQPPKPVAPKLTTGEALSDAQILADIQAGKKINAIKRYRELTGVGLKEAKEAVEASMNNVPLTKSAPAVARVVLSPAEALADADLLAHMQAGKKINAIKRYRELTGVGLKEAKEAVEASMNNVPAASQPSEAVALIRVSPAEALADSRLRAHVQAGKKINAIKRYRELTGAGLKEAKEAVETLFRL